MNYTLTLMKLRYWLLVLALVPGAPAWSQKPMAVLDWRALTTLTTSLLQQLHAQYVPRAAELATAVQSAAGTRVYQDSVRARFRRWLLADAQSTTKGQYSSVLPGVLRTYDLPDLQRVLGRWLLLGSGR